MRIGITYNLKSDLPASVNRESSADDANEEFDSPATIEAIAGVLSNMGHEVECLGGDAATFKKIEKFRPEFVFNIAEGFDGRSREAHIPAMLELLHIPYSGSDPLALALTLEKSLTKRIASTLGIPTPAFWILDKKNEMRYVPEKFPMFVKPLWEGSSKGIRNSSRVLDHEAMGREIDRLFEGYPGCPILIEEFIEGREFTVGVIGNEDPKVIGVMEIVPKKGRHQDFYYSLEVKRRWKELVTYECPAKIDERLEFLIKDAVTKLFKTLRLRDIARFDFRLNANGQLHFLEVNPLPGLSPESGDIVILAEKKGTSFDRLISKILNAAFSRYPELSKSAANS